MLKPIDSLLLLIFLCASSAAQSEEAGNAVAETDASELIFQLHFAKNYEYLASLKPASEPEGSYQLRQNQLRSRSPINPQHTQLHNYWSNTNPYSQQGYWNSESRSLKRLTNTLYFLLR